MKRREMIGLGLAVGLGGVLLLGCNGGGKVAQTPEQRVALAGSAGSAVAFAYLAVDKPEDVKATVIKVVIDQVKVNVARYGADGFLATFPAIQDAVIKALPSDTGATVRSAAEKLVKLLLKELDNLFAKHADWKDKSEEVAAIVGAFCSGASSAFDSYIQTRELPPPPPAKP